MDSTGRTLRAFGMVGGRQRMACQQKAISTSKGLFYGDDVLTYSTPALLVQCTLIFFTTRFIYFLIRPLRQSMLTAQILAGMVLGPSIFARQNLLAKLFTPEGKLTLETLANFGFMFHAFILGLQFDPATLRKIGRVPLTVGLCSTLVPLIAGNAVYRLILVKTTVIESDLVFGLYFMVAINSMTSFIVTTSFLTDINILNSELGRLATLTTIISDFSGWFMGAFGSNIVAAITSSMKAPLLSIATMVAFYIVLLFAIRPLIIYLVCNGPGVKEKAGMTEGKFIAVLIIVLVFAYIADVIGQHWIFAAFVFGVCLPAKPPLNTILVQKLHTVATDVLLPVYCANGGLRTDFWSVGTKSSLFIELLIVVGYIGKFIGTILPALYFELSLRDALCLALIMCSKGIIEICSYCLWMDTKVVNKQIYTLLIISMVFVIGVCRPTVSYMYDPSKRYTKNMSNLGQRRTDGLRMLVCIHSEENVRSMVNLLEASNPTRISQITAIILQLSELSGLTASVLAPVHQRNNIPTSDLTRSERIVKAFQYFERRSHGTLVLQHFTALTPYASMHDDVCNLALDKHTNIIIVPYHKKWAIDGSVEATFPSIRAVNQNIIMKAPCSVGILIDRNHIRASQTALEGQYWHRLVLLYVGGSDDREALEYSKRMANHHSISLTVLWLRSSNMNAEGSYANDDRQRDSMDIELMREFQFNAEGNEKLVYREQFVKDGIGTTKLIRSLEEAFDLFIVGRHHDADSDITLGLTEWSECPELGIIGDMLATSDYQFSVLVIQQS